MADLPTQARILIVDDDPTNRKLLRAQLSLAGFEHLLLASNGQEALDTIASHPVDLVLLDVMMPDLSGLDVTRRLRESFSSQFLPVILISALQEPHDRVQGLDAGANDYLSRPVDSEELVARVSSMLALKQARDDLDAERQRLALLYDVSRGLAAELDSESLMQRILSYTIGLTGAEKGILVLLDEHDEFQVKIRARLGEEPSSVSTIDPQVFHEGLIGWVLEHRQPALIPNLDSDRRWVSLADDEPAQAALAAPLVRAGHAIGVLLLVSSRPGAFTYEHLNMLTAMTSQATIAFENARLYQESRRQRARSEALLDQTGDPVIVLSPDSLITSINPAARKILGLGEQVLNRPIDKVFNLALVDLVQRAQERCSPVSGEFTLTSTDGHSKRVFNVSVSPVEEVGFMLVWQDITSLKESERVRIDSERAETQRVRATFSRYMSPALVERVLGDPDILTRQERRDAVVLFADLRGFTRLTVEHPADAVLALLNDVFAHMMEIVYAYEGVIFDIAGDELLIAFNVPYSQPDASQRALQTAMTMQRDFATLRESWARQGMRVGMGIGINRGMVVLGHVGGRSRMNYAMVGQAVNVAHRLVSAAEDGQIVLTPDLLADDPTLDLDFTVRQLGSLKIKGIDAPQPVALLEQVVEVASSA